MCLLPPSSTLFPYTTLFRSLFEGVAQGFILGVLDRVETREHHRFGVPVAGEGLDRRPRGFRERLAHLRVRHPFDSRSEEHTSELQSHSDLVCRLLLEKKKKI